MTDYRFHGAELRVGDRFENGRDFRLKVRDAKSKVLIREGRIGTVVSVNNSIGVSFEGSTRIYRLRQIYGSRV